MTNGERTGFILLLGFLLAVYFFVFGESGLLERSGLVARHERIRQKIEALTEENAELQKRYESYKEGELLQEEAHRAGYVAKGEKVVFLHPGDGRPALNDEKTEAGGTVPIEPAHFRILWGVVSMLSIVYYFARRSRAEEG